jgi:hypothetical protein
MSRKLNESRRVPPAESSAGFARGTVHLPAEPQYLPRDVTVGQVEQLTLDSLALASRDLSRSHQCCLGSSDFVSRDKTEEHETEPLRVDVW